MADPKWFVLRSLSLWSQMEERRTLARTPALDPGDKVEYGISVRIVHGGREAWLSHKAKGTVREDESGARASRRIETLVEDRVAKKAQEFIDSI